MAAPPHGADDDGYFRQGWTGWLYLTWMPRPGSQKITVSISIVAPHVGRVPRPDGSWTTPFTVSLGLLLCGAVLTYWFSRTA